MPQPPEVWVFFASNVLVFVLAGGLTFIAFKAYRRERTRSLLFAVIGFCLITVSALLEGVYQFGMEESYFLTGLELLRLQTAEKSLFVLGIALLLYSLIRMQ